MLTNFVRPNRVSHIASLRRERSFGTFSIAARNESRILFTISINTQLLKNSLSLPSSPIILRVASGSSLFLLNNRFGTSKDCEDEPPDGVDGRCRTEHGRPALRKFENVPCQVDAQKSWDRSYGVHETEHTSRVARC